MAYSVDMVRTMQAEPAVRPWLPESKFAGELCLLRHDKMICAGHTGQGMYRVGKRRGPRVPDMGAGPLSFSGRVRPGRNSVQNGDLHRKPTEMSLAHAASPSPK